MKGIPTVQSPSSPSLRPRIVWIDAMRGMLAVSVVVIHTYMGLGATARSINVVDGVLPAIMKVIHVVAVPGFAFVSGMMMMRVGEKVDARSIGRRALRRIVGLIVPCFVFLLLWKRAEGWAFMSTLRAGPNYFLLALANISAVYFLLRVLCGKRHGVFLAFLLATTLVFSAVLAMWHSSPVADTMCWRETCDLMLFFTIGVFFSRSGGAERWMAWPGAWCVTCGAFVVMLIVYINIGDYPWMPRGVWRVLTSVCGIAALASLVFSFRRWPEPLARVATYGGSRTLSLYVLHTPLLSMTGLFTGLVADVLTLPLAAMLVVLSWSIHDAIHRVGPLHLLCFGTRRVV